MILEIEEEWILSIFILYLGIISSWKRAGPFLWTTLNSLHPRMLCAKFAQCFSLMYFRYFVTISSKKDGPFCWSKDALCQVWLKLVQWFLRSRRKHDLFTTTTRTTTTTTDNCNGQIVIRKAHPRSQRLLTYIYIT